MKLSAKTAYDIEGRRKYLNGDEGRRFVRHATNLPRINGLFCLVIYYTRCRISEAIALRRGDIDVEMSVIRIRSLKKRCRREIRRIPVPEFLIAGLTSVTVTSDDQTLWKFSRTTAWRMVKSVMKSAQISGIHATAKGLRHAFGVRGAMVHIPVSLIQNWMGHSDSATTAIYLSVKDEEERTLIEKTW